MLINTLRRIQRHARFSSVPGGFQDVLELYHSDMAGTMGMLSSRNTSIPHENRNLHADANRKGYDRKILCSYK